MTRKQGPGPGQPPLQRQRRIRERNRNIVVDPNKKISGGLGRKRFLKWYANCLIWLLKLYLDLDWIVYFSCLLPRRVHCTFIAYELHPPPVVRWRVRRRRLYMQSFFRIHTWYYGTPMILLRIIDDGMNRLLPNDGQIQTWPRSRPKQLKVVLVRCLFKRWTCSQRLAFQYGSRLNK